MRFLWVEDFDGGKTGKSELKTRLERAFQINNDENSNINMGTLQETLEYLEKGSSWYEFDAILIDIRFRVCNDSNNEKTDEESIYNMYFKEFLTHKKYEDYTKKITGDVNSASSGILLYLALIHRYNYPKSRIAFVTANVDETSNKLSDINSMRDIVAKKRMDNLTEDDINDFRLCNEDLYEEYKNQYDLKDEEFDIPETDQINWDDLSSLEKKINSVERKLKKNLLEQNSKKSGLKYKSVREEFEKVGLMVPVAFEKPVSTSKNITRWSFVQWAKELNTGYYKLRARILPICLEINDILKKKELANNCYEIKNTKAIENLMCDMMTLFPAAKWDTNDTVFHSTAVREALYLGDLIKPKSSKDDCSENNRKRILKIGRNWIVHQGIQGISVVSIIFTFVLVLKQFIKISNGTVLSSLIEKLEKEYINIYDINDIDDAVKKISKMQEQYIYDFKNNCQNNQKKKENESVSYATVISGIGHENSPIKDTVSMDHLYSLYLLNLREYMEEKADLNYGELAKIVYKDICDRHII